MTLSPYNPNDRYRQRSARRMSTLFVLIFFFVMVFAAGFWAGGIRSQRDMYILKEEKRIANVERDIVRADITKMRAESQTAKVRLEQVRANYDEVIGEGNMKDLVSLIRQQVDQGVDIKRLESVILSARPPQNCGAPTSKRFVVNTPEYNGPESNAVLPDGIVIVTANGVPAQNSTGKKEAWYDPGKPIEVHFKIKDGKAESKKGLLPMYQTIIYSNKEYRFTISAGDKSFINITYDYCDYP